MYSTGLKNSHQHLIAAWFTGMNSTALQHLGLNNARACQSYDAIKLPETVQREFEVSKKVPQSQSWAGVRRRNVDNKIVDSMFLRCEIRLSTIRETVSMRAFDISLSILLE